MWIYYLVTGDTDTVIIFQNVIKYMCQIIYHYKLEDYNIVICIGLYITLLNSKNL